ncbi:MAG: hypothetical protein PUB37_08360 [Firmicutes bacterium]|nr:hypothetical protein [Bacillota bacterium]
MEIFNFFKETLNKKKPTDDFDTCLLQVFDILSHKDKYVMGEIRACLNDTCGYFEKHISDFDSRDITYSTEAEKWIKFVAAVDALERAGYAAELDCNKGAYEFAEALKAVLKSNGTDFSLKNMKFDPKKSIPELMAQFNEYAGQSGLTIMLIDIYSDCYVICAAEIAAYAEAAEIASRIGVYISCRYEN